jgi:hypothetical protein
VGARDPDDRLAEVVAAEAHGAQHGAVGARSYPSVIRLLQSFSGMRVGSVTELGTLASA